MLDKKFLIFSEYTPDEFADEIHRLCSKEKWDELDNLEIDMSKYDKSREALLFECKLMRAFGVPQYFIDVWKYAHEYTVLKGFNNEVMLMIMYRRKSGDPSTYVGGNTTFLMAVLSMLVNFAHVVIAAFSGDDSFIKGNYVLCCLILIQNLLRIISIHTFVQSLSLDSKIKLFFVPEPVKLVTKLGRSDLVNWEEHVEDYRISFVDMVQCYGDWRLYEPLTEAINERYACKFGQYNMVYNTIYIIFVRI